MSDIGLTWDPRLCAADFSIEENDLATNAGLENAVLISLFTDRRAEDGDELPTSETDRRGWWGDAHPVVPGHKMGSRLWLLARSKRTQEVVTRAEEYAREALEWLVEDLVAERVDVESGIVGNGILGLSITIHRPKADAVNYRFNYNWAAQEARRA